MLHSDTLMIRVWVYLFIGEKEIENELSENLPKSVKNTIVAPDS